VVPYLLCFPITLDTCIQSVRTKASSRTRKRDEVVVIAKRLRCATMTDTSLDPNNGELKYRLSRSGIDHMLDEPSTGKDKTRCQLHRWLRFECCRNAAFCRACNVHLLICVSCYRLHHSERDIAGQK